MPIAAVASNTWLSAVTGGTSTSIAKAFAVNVTTGSLIVAVATIQDSANNDPATFSDSQGNTWAVGKRQYSAALGQSVAIGYAVASSTGALTVTQAGTNSVKRAIAICEYTGANTASLVDVFNGTTSSAAGVPAPGAMTTTVAGLIVSACQSDTTAQTAGSSYSLQIDSLSANYFLSVQDRITTGALTAENAAFGTSKSFWLAAAVAFKASGGGGGTVKKLKVAVHSSAASASGVEGVVFASSAGIAGSEIGEFSGKTFETATEGSGDTLRAILKVPVADFGGAALSAGDTVYVCVRNATYTTGIIAATIIEE